MDIKKLIERLNQYSQSLIAHKLGADFADACMDAATAIETLQIENQALRNAANGFKAENEKLRAENSMLRKMQPVELSGDATTSFELAQEVSRLRADLENERAHRIHAEQHADAFLRDCERLNAQLERVTAERDAIERDFRAFTEQWWEEANGFPCRFCKFEKSGGCEQKGKHPDDEKLCAGRWFEWRGIKED